MMAYKFNPEDWRSERCPNRLSTRQGEYAEAPFCLNVNKLTEQFFRCCRYTVAWNSKVNNRFFRVNCVDNTDIPLFWMEQNLQGFWREIGFSEKMRSDRYRKIYKNYTNVVRFQRKQDAILFKLTWMGHES